MTRQHQPPADTPCRYCPLRRDVPSGIWARHEYDKLRGFDAPTPDQPASVFGCHKDDARLCAGWVAVVDTTNSLGLRLAVVRGHLDLQLFRELADYRSPVPVFDTCTEAADHGMTDFEALGPEADHARRILLARHEHLRLHSRSDEPVDGGLA